MTAKFECFIKGAFGIDIATRDLKIGIGQALINAITDQFGGSIFIFARKTLSNSVTVSRRIWTIHIILLAHTVVARLDKLWV